jgi:hypothetical protein
VSLTMIHRCFIWRTTNLSRSFDNFTRHKSEREHSVIIG